MLTPASARAGNEGRGHRAHRWIDEPASDGVFRTVTDFPGEVGVIDTVARRAHGGHRDRIEMRLAERGDKDRTPTRKQGVQQGFRAAFDPLAE